MKVIKIKNGFVYKMQSKEAPRIDKQLKQYNKLKSHIVEIDNNPDDIDDYYFIVLEKTKAVRELLEDIKNGK